MALPAPVKAPSRAVSPPGAAHVQCGHVAALAGRARGRALELRARGVEVDTDTARRDIAARDAQDSSRVLAPLRKADDAIEVDTTGLSVDQVVGVLAEMVER